MSSAHRYNKELGFKIKYFCKYGHKSNRIFSTHYKITGELASPKENLVSFHWSRMIWD
jgi:hypothetical protein